MAKESDGGKTMGGHLVLSRRKGQALYIGRGVTITILDTDGNNVRLGIVAPKCVIVSRDDFTLETHMQRQREAEQDSRERAW